MLGEEMQEAKDNRGKGGRAWSLLIDRPSSWLRAGRNEKMAGSI
jgi:hypothetical protein